MIRPGRLGCVGLVLAGGLALGLGPGVPAAVRAEPSAPFLPGIGGPFSLVDHTGRSRSDRDFRGRYLLVFFGYASCDGICPVALRRMAAALDLLGPAGGRVQPLFITVDPERDTPARLREFVAEVHPRLIGLTGTPAQVAGAARAYRVEAETVGRSLDDRPRIRHGSFVYLMGPRGELVSLLPPVMDRATMAQTIARHVR